MESRSDIIYDIQALGTDSLDQLLSKAASISLEIQRGTSALQGFASELAVLKQEGRSTAEALAKIAFDPEGFKQNSKIAGDVIKALSADIKASAADIRATAKLDEEAWKEAERIYVESNDARAKSDQDMAGLKARLLREETAAAKLAAQEQSVAWQEAARIRKEQSSGEEISERDRSGLKRQLQQQELAGDKLRSQQLKEGLAEEARIRKAASDAEAAQEKDRANLAKQLRQEEQDAAHRASLAGRMQLSEDERAQRKLAADHEAALAEDKKRSGGGGGGGGFFSAIAPDSPLGGFARGASGLGFFGSASFFAGDLTRRAIEELGRLVVETTHNAREMENLASRFGITAGEATKLSSAAELVGLKFDSIQAGSRALGTALESPSGEGRRAADALDKLGVSIRNTNGTAREMGPVFMEVLAALSKIPDTSTRVALANQILGRGAKEIEPLIANLAELTSVVQGLGIGSDEQIHKLAAVDQKFRELQESWQQLKRDFVEKLSPEITYTVNIIRKWIDKDREEAEVAEETTEFRKANPGKFVTADRLADFAAQKALKADLEPRNKATGKEFDRRVLAEAGLAEAKRNRAKFGESIEGLEFDLAEAKKALREHEGTALRPHGEGPDVVAKAGESIETDRLEVERLEAALKKARKQDTGAFHSDQYAEKLASIMEQSEAALRTPTQVADLESKRDATALVEAFRREHKGAFPPARDLDTVNAAFVQRREVAEDKEHDQDVKREGIESEFEKIAPGLERQSFNKDRDFQFREALMQGKRDLDEQQRIRQEALRAQFDTGQEEAQLNRGRARITQIQAGPADQGRAAIQNFNLRAREIEQEHQYELAVVKTMDAEKQKAAAEEANHKARTAQLENEIDLQVKLAEAQKQREDKIRSNAEGAFRALISKDGGGIRDFFKAQALGMATTVAGNVGVELMKNVHANLPDSVLKGADGKANVLGRVLEGTPFGINHENEIKEAQAKLKDSNLLLKASVDANTKALGGEAPAGGDADLGDRTAHTATNALHKATGIWDELKHLFHKPKPAPPPTITEPELPAPSAPSIPADISPDLGDAGDSHASMGASLDALTAIIGGTPPSGGSAAFNGDPDSLIGILRRPAPGQASPAQSNPFSPFGTSETIRENPSVAPSFDFGSLASLLKPAALPGAAPLPNVDSGSGTEGSDAATLGGLMAAVQPNAAGNPAALLPKAPGASRSPISAIASAVPIVRDILGLFHSPGMPAPGRQPQDRHGFPTGGHQVYPATPSAARNPGAPDPAIKSITDKLSAERDNTHALIDSTKALNGLDADIKKLDAEIARLIAQEAQCGCGGSKQQQSSTGGLGGVLGSLGGLLGGLGGGGADSGITSVLSGAFGADGTPILEELGGSQGIGGGLSSLLGGGSSGGSGGLGSILGSLGNAPAFTGPNDSFGGLTGEDLGNLGDFNPSELGQLDNSAAGTAPDLGMDSIADKLGGGGKGSGGLSIGGVLAAGAGTFQAIKGFQQGGARGDVSGVGGALTAAGGIASMIPGGQIVGIALGVAGGIADLVAGLLPDPKEERKKGLQNEIDNQYKYIPPAQKDYYFSMEGGGSDKGIGGVARTGGQTVLQTVNINTMDTIGFKDFLQRNTNAFAGAMNYALTNSGNQTLNQTLSKVVSTTPR